MDTDIFTLQSGRYIACFYKRCIKVIMNKSHENDDKVKLVRHSRLRLSWYVYDQQCRVLFEHTICIANELQFQSRMCRQQIKTEVIMGRSNTVLNLNYCNITYGFALFTITR